MVSDNFCVFYNLISRVNEIFFNIVVVLIACSIGMDSLMAVEIKQVLERDFEINITVTELRAMTFGKLQELTDSISKGEKPIKEHKTAITRNILFRSLGDEKMADEVIVPLNVTDRNEDCDTYALLISGVEGVISPALYTLCKSIEVPVYALQYYAYCRVETFSELVSLVSKVVTDPTR